MKLDSYTFGADNERAKYKSAGYYGYGGANWIWMRSVLSVKQMSLSGWESCKELATRNGRTRYIVYQSGRIIPTQIILNKIKDKINKKFPNALQQLSRIPRQNNSVYFQLGRGYGKSRVLCHSVMTMIHSLVFGKQNHLPSALATSLVLRKCKGKTPYAKTQKFRQKVIALRQRYYGASIRGPVNFMTYYKNSTKKRKKANANA